MSETPTGHLTWIGLRASADELPRVVESAEVVPEQGLKGDHFRGRPGGAGTRQVTLIAADALRAASKDLSREETLDPRLTRRNLVIDGLDLAELRDRRFRIGDEVVLETTGGCPPCAKMDANLGPGGKDALHGRGGLTTRVIRGGLVRIGDRVEPLLSGADSSTT